MQRNPSLVGQQTSPAAQASTSAAQPRINIDIRGPYRLVSRETGDYRIRIRNLGPGPAGPFTLTLTSTAGILEIAPDRVPRTLPGQDRTVTFRLTAPLKLIETPVRVDVTISADGYLETADRTVFIRPPRAFWPLIGGLLGLTVIGLFIFVYRKFGR